MPGSQLCSYIPTLLTYIYVKSEAICMANRLSSKGRPLELWHVPGAALNGLSTLKYTCIGTRATCIRIRRLCKWVLHRY